MPRCLSRCTAGPACPPPLPVCLDLMPAEERSQGSSLADLAHWRSCTGLKSKPSGSVRGFVFAFELVTEVCLLEFSWPHRHQRAKWTFFSSGMQMAACKTAQYFWEGVY